MFFDSHTHTVHSDGKCTLEQMCQAAIQNSVAGFAVTDHADMNFYHERDHKNRIAQCIDQVRQMQEMYAGKLELTCGVELGEYLISPENAQAILQLTDFDVVLCSVHFLPKLGWTIPYNRIPFSREGTDEELDAYLRHYLTLLRDTADAFDFDVLAHIGCPVRYMTGIHGRKTDIMRHEELLRQILQRLIDRGISLEWNTGGMNPRCGFCNIQNDEIFALYYAMGGRLVTLGSDAHKADMICRAFPEAAQSLKQIGFTHYQRYVNRKAIPVAL